MRGYILQYPWRTSSVVTCEVHNTVFLYFIFYGANDGFVIHYSVSRRFARWKHAESISIHAGRAVISHTMCYAGARRPASYRQLTTRPNRVSVEIRPTVTRAPRRRTESIGLPRPILIDDVPPGLINYC